MYFLYIALVSLFIVLQKCHSSIKDAKRINKTQMALVGMMARNWTWKMHVIS